MNKSLQRTVFIYKKYRKIRKIQKEDTKKIIPLLEQVSTLHINMRPDIFKEKTEANMEKEILDIINNEEKISMLTYDNEMRKSYVL